MLLKDNKGQDFDPVPAGMHHAICYGVVDIGTQESPNSKFGPKRKVILLFELPYERIEIKDRGNLPRGVSTKQTASLSEKANLRKMLVSWRGREFTKEELEGFDTKKLLGVNCQLNIIHETKGDKTYANITSIVPLGKGMQRRDPENETLHFSIDDENFDPANPTFPKNMPNWIQGLILNSVEVQSAAGPHEPKPASAPEDAKGPDEDDIPF